MSQLEKVLRVTTATTFGARVAAATGSALLHASAAWAMVVAGHLAPGASREEPAVSSQEVPLLEIELPAATAEPAPRAAIQLAWHMHRYPVPPSHDATPHDPSLVHAHAHAVAPSPSSQEDVPDAAELAAATPSPTPRFVIAVRASAVAPGGAAATDGTGASSLSDNAPVA